MSALIELSRIKTLEGLIPALRDAGIICQEELDPWARWVELSLRNPAVEVNIYRRDDLWILNVTGQWFDFRIPISTIELLPESTDDHRSIEICGLEGSSFYFVQ
jgi:hypothetical protein